MLSSDVLEIKYEIKISEMTEAIASLSQTERERIYKVVGTMIDFDKNR